MNNEPYGWHCFIGKGKEEQDFLFINGKGASKPDANWDKVIPLYTHPVKELTDEEIAGAVARGWCSEKNSMKTMDSDLSWAIVEELKVILRKAQKK